MNIEKGKKGFKQNINRNENKNRGIDRFSYSSTPGNVVENHFIQSLLVWEQTDRQMNET